MRQSLSEDAVRGMVHPFTGEHPLGVRKPRSHRGESGPQPVWRIAGAADDDSGDGDGDGGNDGDGDGSGDGGADDDDNAGGAGDTEDGNNSKGDKRVKELSDEAARRRNEAKQFKKERDEALAKLKEKEDADLGELDKAKKTAEEATATVEKLKADNQRLLIDNAFLTSNKHSWKNPRAALRLVDLSEVEIDDEGEVTGLDKALDALAKSDPYLLADSGDDNDDGDSTPTGQPPARQRSKGNPNREKLLEKYPALRR
jgi:hypothetical protein